MNNTKRIYADGILTFLESRIWSKRDDIDYQVIILYQRGDYLIFNSSPFNRNKFCLEFLEIQIQYQKKKTNFQYIQQLQKLQRCLYAIRPGPESFNARLYANKAMSSTVCLLVNCEGICKINNHNNTNAYTYLIILRRRRRRKRTHEEEWGKGGKSKN